jgi:hypothetical protein
MIAPIVPENENPRNTAKQIIQRMAADLHNDKPLSFDDQKRLLSVAKRLIEECLCQDCYKPKVEDMVQILPHAHVHPSFYGCTAWIEEVRPWGVVAFVMSPEPNPKEPGSDEKRFFPIRLQTGEFQAVGTPPFYPVPDSGDLVKGDGTEMN